ncbi:hypothetical protein FYC62_06900 [Pedobacter aquae]|uniref:Uncharacterized protein n=1 Tax=Pedobacter aquae TaxID=2605747 RepID=A0A5C0VKE6_9SPHI|nr:hypothetical protein [Pedobacter aquae]QEK51424.1 hypothetical protein FYC62_06900 [Pedobacter aquae]
MNKNGAFIPQQIKLDIYLGDQPIPFNDYEKEISIGTAFDFDTKKLPEVGKEIILQVPEGYEQYLKLYTHIRIHENIWLKNPKSTITFPLFISALRKKEPCKIAFSYQEHAIPRLDFQYLQEI